MIVNNSLLTTSSLLVFNNNKRKVMLRCGVMSVPLYTNQFAQIPTNPHKYQPIRTNLTL